MDTTPPKNTNPPDQTPTPPGSDTSKKAPTTVVMSKLEAELAAERARVETELAFARSTRQKLTTKKIITIAAIVAVALGIFGALFYFLTQAISGQYHPGGTAPDGSDPTPGQVLPVIEGYRCTTEKCAKVAELTPEKILIRDTAYFVFTRETGEIMKTTIDAIDFRSFTPFHWGDSLLLILERATGRQGLYSISSNRPLTTSFNYASFYRDIAADIYKGMEWVEGRFILASAPPEVRLIDINSGEELVRAAERIFVDHDFIIGFEASGQRRIYTISGARILVAEAPSTLAIRDRHLIEITAPKNFNLFDATGTKLKTSDDYYRDLRDKFRATGKENYADALSDLGAFIIPN